jgi:hypothetical protein
VTRAPRLHFSLADVALAGQVLAGALLGGEEQVRELVNGRRLSS